MNNVNSSPYFAIDDFNIFDKYSKDHDTKNKNTYDQRNNIKQKLLDLLPEIEEHISDNNYKLQKHWKKDYVCSSTKPNDRNGLFVDWIGIRLGKTKDEVDAFRDYENKDYYGYYSHACFQFSLFATGFWIGIYHSFSSGSIDRLYMREEMRNKVFSNKLSEVLANQDLKNFIWNFGKNQYDFSNYNKNEFLKFYKKYEKENSESFFGILVAPNDERIQSKEIIISEIKNIMDYTNEIYKITAKRYFSRNP